MILRYGCENLGWESASSGNLLVKTKYISTTKNKNATKRKNHAKFLLKNPRFSQYRT